MAEEVKTSSSLISDSVEEKEGKLVVVILVGPPGSGKTTFCSDVMNGAQRNWIRISQDTIANGKAGTRAQCLQAATIALQEGQNVLIDRCNLEIEQRSEFVKLSGARTDVHAVVLDLPSRVCISRSVNRTGHEGNLQGGKAAAVINRMLQKKVPPKLIEGFSSITFCQNDDNVKSAVNMYRNFGLFDSLPLGVIGQKSADTKVQQGIMKFLVKFNETDGNSSQNSTTKHGYMRNDLSAPRIENGSEVGKDEQKKETLQKHSFNDIQWKEIPTLAFPSISTSDFQFNHNKASEVIVEAVSNFLSKVNKVKLIMVDLSPKSRMLSLVRDKALQKNVDANRFSTFTGDITRLYTGGGLLCNVIANAANWRLKPGGGGVNAAIFSAGGEALEIATKEQADTINPGNSVIVPVPKTSPLFQREGVAYVIHVLGPNMNLQRPNCLKDDYIKGCKVLYEAYSSLFYNFASIAQCQNDQKTFAKDSKFEPSSSAVRCFDSPVEYQKSKREDNHGYDINKKSKSNEEMASLPQCLDKLEKEVQKIENTDKSAKTLWGSWAQALYQVVMHPEKHDSVIIEISDDFIVMRDIYPKAKKHILVVSKLPGLECLADTRREHLPILKKMHAAGLKWAETFSSQDPSLEFRYGFHSVPSMRQLHLHVISQDFDSPFLKNKKHWNSFNTLFFRNSIDVMEEIKTNGLATIVDEKLLTSELRCHRCKSAHPNITKLKFHIATCKIPFPSNLLNGQLGASSGSSEAVSAT